MEFYYRKKVDFNGTSVKFQAIEWLDSNEVSQECLENIDEDTNIMEFTKYVIKIFGVTEEGHSILCNVNNFTPFFYIKVQDNWTKTKVKIFIDDLFNTPTFRYGKAYYDLKKYRKNILDESCLLQNKKDFYGFNGNKEFKFLRLTFNNSEAMKRVMYKIKSHNDSKDKISGINFKLKLYESNLDSILRFIHIKDLNPAGIIKAEHISISESRTSNISTASTTTSTTSTTQIEVNVDWKNISKVDEDKNFPILQASFDIETYSYDDAFPSPEHRNNCIFQIATAFKYFTHNDFLVKHALALKPCNPIEAENTILETFDTEKELLLRWVDLIKKMDPDILYTYNGDQFDCYYLVKRAILLGIEDEFLENLSRLNNQSCQLIKKEFNSSAYGSTEYNRLIIPGRVNFDILIYMRREYKENSYKLDAISEKYVGENKDPVTAQMMFDAFRAKDERMLSTVMEYCIKDTLLPQKISDKLHILQNQISMSNVTFVPIKFLTEQGQQIKAYSQILKRTRKLNFLVPTLNVIASENNDNKFEGATVLPPLTGAYYEPITVCDFASLYPSIIRAHNLCYSTIVLDSQYLNLEGIEYTTFEWEEDDPDDKEYKKTKKVTYAKNIKGVLPEILKELAESRTKYKKLMKNAKNDFEKEIYNKCQLAVKVSMNSVYGFFAAYKLRCKSIAATVTAIGRKMIKETKEYMQNNYKDCVAIYGDSVTGDTPIILKNTISNFIEIKEIQSISNFWTNYNNFKITNSDEDSSRFFKEKSEIPFYQVYTDKGWATIYKVIRHRCHKKLYRVITNNGSIDVTEDHSLLNLNYEKIKPNKVKLGDSLLSINKFPFYNKVFIDEQSLKYSILKMWGFMFKTIKYLDYYQNDIRVIQLVIRHRDYIILNNFKKLFIDNEKTKYSTPLLDITNEYNQKLQIVNLKITINNESTIFNKYKNLFYNQRNKKKIPDILFNLSLENKKAFIEGYLEAGAQYNEYEDVNKTASQSLIYILKECKKECNISLFTGTTQLNSIENNKIIEIIELGYTSSFVYDIETSIGRFHAGIGKIVVSNTDSVFVKFKTETTEFYKKEKDRISKQVVITQKDNDYLKSLLEKCIQESMDLGKKAAQHATKDLFVFPINLEYEKVYSPLMMLSKKRYIGKLYSENASSCDYIDKKGIVLKRRDNFKLLRDVYQKIVDIYMEKGSLANDEILEYINTIMKNIENKNIDLNDLIITKSLRKDYKSQNIPHVVLARKITERDPNNAPRSNDRISYLFIDTQNPKTQPQYMKVEDPVYVQQNNLPLDVEYYIKFLENPLCELMELFMENPHQFFKEKIKKNKEERKIRLLGNTAKIKNPKKVTKKLTQPKLTFNKK